MAARKFKRKNFKAANCLNAWKNFLYANKFEKTFFIVRKFFILKFYVKST